MQKKHVLWELFRSTFMISAFTFGGGYVIVPMMKKRFVEELHWVAEQEMLDMIAIAQSAPGAIAINTSVILGYRMAHILGAFVTVCATALPPFLALISLYTIYANVKDVPIVLAVLQALQVAVAAIVLDVVFDLMKGIASEKSVGSWFIVALSLVLAFVLQWQVLPIMLTMLLVGIVVRYAEYLLLTRRED